MHARHYSPALGRFLQPDPDRSEANPYAYAANNPVTEIDPDGTCFIVCAVVGAAVSVAIYAVTTDNFDLGEAAREAAIGGVLGMTGVGLVSKIASGAKLLSKVSKASRVLSKAKAVVKAGQSRASTAALRFAAKHRILPSVVQRIGRHAAKQMAERGGHTPNGKQRDPKRGTVLGPQEPVRIPHLAGTDGQRKGLTRGSQSDHRKDHDDDRRKATHSGADGTTQVNERQMDVIQRLRAYLRATINPEEPSQRAEHIAAFQSEVWSTGEQIGSERLDRLLRDLAFDLDFYEPDPRIRMEDRSYFGDERLQQSLEAALGDAAWADSLGSHGTVSS